MTATIDPTGFSFRAAKAARNELPAHGLHATTTPVKLAFTRCTLRTKTASVHSVLLLT
jgi:hypothetical protein